MYIDPTHVFESLNLLMVLGTFLEHICKIIIPPCFALKVFFSLRTDMVFEYPRDNHIQYVM